MVQDLPFSPACERNRGPISEVLGNIIPSKKTHFLELGFGTLQHAIHFCRSFKNLIYYASDQKSYHPIFEANRAAGNIPPNLFGPSIFEAREKKLYLEVKSAKEDECFDFIFTANSLHIMGWEEAKSLLSNIHNYISPSGEFLIYGPFNFEGRFTSASNQSFDASLKQRYPKSGIRDFEEIVELLKRNGLHHLETIPMPANNFFLRFQKG